jgi:hypothetical protein
MMSGRRSLVVLASTLLLACTSPPPPKKTGGTGGDEDTGGSGGAGKGGTGGKMATGGKGGDTGGSGGGGSGGGGAGGTGGMMMTGEDCPPTSTTLLCKPTGTMPKSIKDTGLFPMLPDRTKHSARMIPYTPDPPLWSDGLEKERMILLPQGQKIDNTGSRWVFPIGTIFIKTFVDDSGPMGAPRAVETRFIRRVADESAFTEYDFYLYEWNKEGTDATLVINDKEGDGTGDQYFKDVKVTINGMHHGKLLKINNGLPFDHTLPSQFMCKGCHTANGAAFQTFIGFDEVRLDKTQLTAMDGLNVFMKPAKAPVPIADPDPKLLAVKRFIFGNCVHCHNEKGSVFDMHPKVFVQNTVNQPTMAQSVDPPPGWLRIVPMDLEKSVVYVQARRKPLPMPNMAGGNRLRPMPPFGVNDDAPDLDGLAALQAWITGLPKK